MAENHRSPGTEEIEITVAIGVEEVSPFGMSHKWRLAVDCAKRPNRRIDASGEKFFGALLQMAGLAMGLRHLFQYKSLSGKTMPAAVNLIYERTASSC